MVDLVAEGLSNPQICQRLYVSRRTVQTHLAHVFAKLHSTAGALTHRDIGQLADACQAGAAAR